MQIIIHHQITTMSRDRETESMTRKGIGWRSDKKINQSTNQLTKQCYLIRVGNVVINVVPVVIVMVNYLPIGRTRSKRCVVNVKYTLLPTIIYGPYLSAEQEARDVLLAGPLLSNSTISISVICLVSRSSPRPDASVEVNTTQQGYKK